MFFKLSQIAFLHIKKLLRDEYHEEQYNNKRDKQLNNGFNIP